MISKNLSATRTEFFFELLAITNQPFQENQETMNGKQEDCIIYLHFPFFIGIGISEKIELVEFQRELNAINKDKSIAVSLNNEFEIAKPKYLDEILQRNFKLTLQTLSVRSKRFSDDCLQKHEDFLFRMVDSVITIFDTGIAVGHFKFKIYFRKDLTANSIYNAYKHLQSQFEPLERKRDGSSKEPEISKIIWELISLLTHARTELSKIKPKDGGVGELPTAYYTYPLFFIQKARMEDLKEFLSLLYLRPSKELVSNDELLKAYNSNTSVMSDEFFVAKWDAAVCSLMDEKNSDTLSDLLDLSSYVWNSEYEMETYLTEQLQALTVTKLTTAQARERLSQIQRLKIRVKEVQGIYTRISVSLWTGVLHILDKILYESWNLTKLDKSLNDKMNNLSLNYQYIVDEEERLHNSKLNKTLLNLQRLSIPLAIMIGLLPIISDKDIHDKGLFSSFPAVPIFFGILITAIFLVASYFIINILGNKIKSKEESY